MSEVIKWGRESFTINKNAGGGREFAWDGSPFRLHKLPAYARVYPQESKPNWRGHEGRTLFIYQEPPVHITGEQGYMAPKPYEANSEYLLGVGAQIYPTGEFYPPELPQILTHLQNDWGWDIDPQLRTRFGISDPKQEGE